MAELSAHPEKCSITCALEGGLIVLRRRAKPSPGAGAGAALTVQQLNMREHHEEKYAVRF